MGSNSGAGICRLGKTGGRTRDIDDAIQQAARHPGITGLGAAWQLAGGQFDADGHPAGVCRPMTIGELAKVMKRPARMLEAVDKDKLKKGPATVHTHAKSSGFYPLGDYIRKAVEPAIQQAEKPDASPSAQQCRAKILEALDG